VELPKIESLDLSGKKVVVRADLDVGESLEGGDDIKLATLLDTFNYLLGKNAEVIAIGHRGRPKGKFDKSLSLRFVVQRLSELLKREVVFVENTDELKKKTKSFSGGVVFILENLRFDPREEENDKEFAKELASLGEVYINEAFSVSHKEHSSIVSLPGLLPHAAGFHFVEEIENLKKVFSDSSNPVVIIIGGVKKGKLKHLDDLKKFSERILIGGRLPIYLRNDRQYIADRKIIVAQLNQDKEDITIHSIEEFQEEIKKAGSVVIAGPMGKFEENGQSLGTKRILEAVAKSKAYKVAGGGDTEQAIAKFGLTERFDWISVGGGAALQFLAEGTLPGIEALLS
jgi:3-phosphoglycerate kinase